jgi:hypothetical protein
VHDADAVGVGQEHRTLKLAGFLDPCRTRQLARTVQREPAGKGMQIQAVAAARQDRRDAGAHLLAALEVLDQRHLTHRHADDVGDGVQRPRLAVEGHAKIPRPGTRLGNPGH